MDLLNAKGMIFSGPTLGLEARAMAKIKEYLSNCLYVALPSQEHSASAEGCSLAWSKISSKACVNGDWKRAVPGENLVHISLAAAVQVSDFIKGM